MLGAAQSMAVGTVMMPWITGPRVGVDPVMATGLHMIIGGVPLLLASVGTEYSVLSDRLSGLTWLDGGLLTYVSVCGGALGYGVFFENASRGNLTALSSLTFLTPVFAATVGFWALGEQLTVPQLVGGVVTLLAVFLINTNEGEGSGPLDSVDEFGV